MPTTQSADRTARIKRIKNRGCPQIIDALCCGEVGVKTLERLTRLPLEEQPIELARVLEARQANARRQAAWRADPRAGKTPFASQAYAEARARRLRRIAKRASVELVAAYEEGRLSLRAYDLLSRRSPSLQKKAIRSDRHKEQAQSLAALTIRAVLAKEPQRIDLGLIAAKIITAIRGKTVAL